MVSISAAEGLVTGVTRRYITVAVIGGEIRAYLPSCHQDIVIGDRVSLDNRGTTPAIAGILPRKNCLSRVYESRTRNLAANLDLVFIVAAVPPLFNTTFVDRVLTVAYSQGIGAAIVINKIDLGIESSQPFIDLYRSLDYPVLLTSAIEGGGLQDLEHILNNGEFNIVGLTGISGVGKSAILNGLIPAANRKTADVSRKTGLGKQTTSMALGFNLSRTGLPDLLLIDFPGIQNFGVSSLDKQVVLNSFSEFRQLGACEYSDCWHLAEPRCSVKAALSAGRLAPSRYESYTKMLKEIESAREY